MCVNVLHRTGTNVTIAGTVSIEFETEPLGTQGLVYVRALFSGNWISLKFILLLPPNVQSGNSSQP